MPPPDKSFSFFAIMLCIGVKNGVKGDNSRGGIVLGADCNICYWEGVLMKDGGWKRDEGEGELVCGVCGMRRWGQKNLWDIFHHLSQQMPSMFNITVVNLERCRCCGFDKFWRCTEEWG